MISVREYVENGVKPTVDWQVSPWSEALPLLKFLGMAPNETIEGTCERALPPEDLALLCAMTVALFETPKGPAWSSEMLRQALSAASRAAKGPPEALIFEFWLTLEKRPLDRNCWDFCRALGNATLAGYRKERGWDLAWMLNTSSDSQRCLRYWTLGVRPDLWTDALAAETNDAFSGYPFAR